MIKMKILYAACSHGDTETRESFRQFAGRRKPDAVVFAGDLIAPIFDENEMKLLGISMQMLSEVRVKVEGFDGKTLEEIADKLSANNECPEVLKRGAQAYIELNEKAKAETDRQYAELKKFFESFKAPVLTVPGNWDTTNLDDFLAEYNLHNKNHREVAGVSFAGYGASYESMRGILPVSLEMPFAQTEMFEFLSKHDPDIAVVHCPPYGICDTNGRGEHIGIFGIRAYIAEQCPNVVLVGHNHEPSVEQLGNTVVINPGNLGRYALNPSRGNGAFGTFVEFELGDHNYFKEATLYQITEHGKASAKAVARCRMDGDELIVERD